MATLTLKLVPQIAALRPGGGAQLSYLLTSVAADEQASSRPINWTLLVDTSRSMRIPIVTEAQFRSLVQQSGAQEMLVDGVPVWQLGERVPATMRAAAPSAVDFVARALHSFIERIDQSDRFSLIACAERAEVLLGSTPGSQRHLLVDAIERLATVRLGSETDLAIGLELALQQQQVGRNSDRVNKILLLTDGFTRDPETCLHHATAAARNGTAITTLGLGYEFQEELLTAMADRSGGRAYFLQHPNDVPRVIASELEQARHTAVRAVTIDLRLADGVTLRRATQIHPTLTALDTLPSATASQYAFTLGDLAAQRPISVLLECIISSPPSTDLMQIQARSTDGDSIPISAPWRYQESDLPAAVRTAAALANAVHLQQQAVTAESQGNLAESSRLWNAAASRFDSLQVADLAAAARRQANTLASGLPATITGKQVIYDTRRLGEA